MLWFQTLVGPIPHPEVGIIPVVASVVTADEATKVCKHCEVEKPLSEYGLKMYYKGRPYLDMRCKACRNLLRRKRAVPSVQDAENQSA